MKKKKIYTIYDENGALKCPGCSFWYYRLYVLADDAEDAMTKFEQGKGYCAECFVQEQLIYGDKNTCIQPHDYEIKVEN